jgi:multiple sugar transport system substrate-binding protein
VTERWTRRRVLHTLVGITPFLAGCTVSGSLQQQQAQEIANATATPTAGATPTVAGTAAATPSTSPGPAATFTPGGKVALRFGAAGSSGELDAYDAAVAAYTKATPNTMVTVERQSGDSTATRAAALAADTAPDLITVPWDSLAAWGDEGALDDVTALLGAGKVDLSGDYRQLQDFATVNSVTLALPLSYNPRVLYYNNDLFAAAGLKAPGDTFDWSAFEAAATKLTAGTTRSGFATGTAPFDWMPWVWAAGGSVFDDDLAPTTCTLTDAPSASGLQRFADLWLQHRGAAPPSTVTAGETPLASFLKGTAGMVAGDRSTLASLTPASFKWQVTYLPQGPGGHATTYSATLIAVSKSCRQPLVAGNVAGYLATDKTAQGLLAKTGVVVPALRAAAESPDFKFSGAAVDDAVFTRTLLFAYQPPRSKAWPQVPSAWNPDLQKLWAGQQSAADAAKALTPKVNDALKGVAATPTVQPFAIQPPTPTPAPTATPAAPPTAAPTPASTPTPAK